MSPTVSPVAKANGLIAFIAGDDPTNSPNVYTMRPDGSDVTGLPIHVGAVRDLAWSPDGKKLAFAGGGSEFGDFAIYTCNADGSELRKVTGNAYFVVGVTWSPDGRIAFGASTMISTANGSHNSGYSIRVMNADGSDLHVVPFQGQAWEPAWSPDGSEIAFSSNRSGQSYDIYTMRPDGSDVRQITTGSGMEAYPTWSPDGSQIAYVAPGSKAKTSGDLTALEVTTRTGGAPYLLLDCATVGCQGIWWSPDWAPAGQMILISTWRGARLGLMNVQVPEGLSDHILPSGEWAGPATPQMKICCAAWQPIL
jgi:Tol biopolymer transport system component